MPVPLQRSRQAASLQKTQQNIGRMSPILPSPHLLREPSGWLHSNFTKILDHKTGSLSYIVRRYLCDPIRLATVLGAYLVTDGDVNGRTVKVLQKHLANKFQLSKHCVRVLVCYRRSRWQDHSSVTRAVRQQVNVPDGRICLLYFSSRAVLLRRT